MKKKILAVLPVVLLSPSWALGADSGSTLRQYKESTVLTPGKTPAEAIQYPTMPKRSGETASGADQPTVLIHKINVVGQTVLSRDAVQAVLVPYTGKVLSSADIHAAADALMAAIRNAGAFAAKVYIQPQSIIDNTLTLNVIEGHLAKDGVVLGRSSERVRDEVMLGQLKHTLEPGGLITAAKVERAIYLTNDLPGIKGTSNHLLPADKVGEAKFEVTPTDARPVTGYLSYDNFGSYFTGRNRIGGAVELNSPAGRGDKLVLGANASELGTAFGYMDASLLAYPNGLRAGGTLDYLNYKTEEDGNLRGTALDGSLYLYYPVTRSRTRNLYANFKATHTRLKDESDEATITDRVLNTGSLRFNGDRTDSFMGGGVTTASLEAVAGNVNLDGYEPFKDYDAQHANTQGNFARAAYSLTRLQHLAGNFQAYAAVNGQFASGRMDPSQSLSFGGPYDFPGYHAGEVFGDEGWMMHADLRYNVPSPPWEGQLQLSAFYDFGGITSHTVAIVGGFPVPGAVDHKYHIRSAGFGLSQTWKNLQVQGVLGWQVDNEIPDQLLDDQGEDSFQGWINLVYSFQ